MRGLRVLPWKGLLGSGLGCLLAVFLAGSAHATAYTVNQAVDLSLTFQGGATNVVGSILPVSSAPLSGTLGNCLVGTCNLDGHDFLVYQVQLGAGSLSINYIRSSLVLNGTYPALAIGYVDTSNVAPTNASNITLSTSPEFDFSALTAGTSSDLLYAIYGSGAFANTATQKLSFSVSPSSGNPFSPTAVGFAVVPEPGTAALLLLGTPVLALLRRRRSRG